MAYIEIYCLIALITIRQCLPLCVAMSPFLFHSQFRSPLLSPVANAKEFHLNYFLMSCSHTHTHIDTSKTYAHTDVLANPVGRLKNGLKMHLIEVVLFFFETPAKKYLNGRRAELFIQRFRLTLACCLPISLYVSILIQSIVITLMQRHVWLKIYISCPKAIQNQLKNQLP